MVAMMEKVENCDITKKIIKVGEGILPKFNNGCKVHIHFKTLTQNEVVVDDSKNYGKSFELLIGKKFKIECWEKCIKTMKVGEIARFLCPVEDVILYPTASKSMREVYFHVKPDNETKQGHQCGLSALEHGLGYNDLDKLQASPAPLIFEIELLKVQEIGEYEREVWQMSDEEMENAFTVYHTEGNTLFKEGKIEDAAEKYAFSISCIKNIQVKMRPGTDDWVGVDHKQIPLLLNHAQCMLIVKNYQQCISNCSEVLHKITGKNNKKALFKRGKAYVSILDEKSARKDFETLLKVDPSTKSIVDKELVRLNELLKERDRELSGNLRGMFKKL